LNQETYPLHASTTHIFANFVDDNYPVLLETQNNENQLGRYSIIASNPFLIIRSKGDMVEICQHGNWIQKKTSPLDELKHLLAKYHINLGYNLPFVGGALGYFSYEFHTQIESIQMQQEDSPCIYDMHFAFYNEAVVIDQDQQELHLIGQNFVANSHEQFTQLKTKTFAHPNKDDLFYDQKVHIKNDLTKEQYLQNISKIKDQIQQGNVYQINFTQRFHCALNKSPWTLYKRLAHKNPSPMAAYFDFSEFQILSSSPERFLKITGDRITTKPIKGTIARGVDPQKDKMAKECLHQSQKDQAELLMIVDLERNDIGRICTTGSVQVRDLFHIETYATLFQQIANVEGKLQPHISIKEIINSTFPGGSITGAPKISAMQLIGKLESRSRNIYTGSLGYISFNSNMDFNIAIRTILCKDNMAYYQVGGGITWDSDPESEYEESLLKGKALKEALMWRKA